MIALADIHRKIAGRGTLNATARIGPKSGVNNGGVRNAMPIIPKRFQMFTAIRFVLLNFLGGVFRRFLIKS
jgi:hypothetical protein